MFEAIAEQKPRQEDKTRQDKTARWQGLIATVMHQRHVEDVKRRKEKSKTGVENGSEDREGCKKGPNLVGILLSRTVDSESLCEMTSKSTPMPQPLVVDSGAAEKVIPRTWFPNPQDSRIK